MLIEPVVLEGRFVRLEPLGAQHLEPLRKLAGGPRETFQFGFVPTPETVDAYVGKALAAAGAKAALPFATCNRDGAVLGCTRLFDLQRWEWPTPDLDPRAGQPVLDAAEIGYTFLAQAAQRTQVNTEAKLLMLRHAFEDWRCLRVTLKTDERNQRSRRAIERLGAHFDGVLRAFQAASDGGARNTAYYTILAAEWPRVRAGLEARLQR